jgi:hypothetical protein
MESFLYLLLINNNLKIHGGSDLKLDTIDDINTNLEKEVEIRNSNIYFYNHPLGLITYNKSDILYEYLLYTPLDDNIIEKYMNYILQNSTIKADSGMSPVFPSKLSPTHLEQSEDRDPEYRDPDTTSSPYKLVSSSLDNRLPEIIQVGQGIIDNLPQLHNNSNRPMLESTNIKLIGGAAAITQSKTTTSTIHISSPTLMDMCNKLLKEIDGNMDDFMLNISIIINSAININDFNNNIKNLTCDTYNKFLVRYINIFKNSLISINKDNSIQYMNNEFYKNYDILIENIKRFLFKDTIDKDTIDKDTIDKDTIDKDTIDKDTIDKDTIDKDTTDIDQQLVVQNLITKLNTRLSAFHIIIFKLYNGSEKIEQIQNYYKTKEEENQNKLYQLLFNRISDKDLSKLTNPYEPRVHIQEQKQMIDIPTINMTFLLNICNNLELDKDTRFSRITMSYISTIQVLSIETCKHKHGTNFLLLYLYYKYIKLININILHKCMMYRYYETENDETKKTNMNNFTVLRDEIKNKTDKKYIIGIIINMKKNNWTC